MEKSITTKRKKVPKLDTKKKKNKASLEKRSKKNKGISNVLNSGDGDDSGDIEEVISSKTKEGKSSKLSKKRKSRKENDLGLAAGANKLYSEVEDGSSKKCVEAVGKSRKAGKMSNGMKYSDPKVKEIDMEYEVYHISSGDEDSSKGMKKWVEDYYQSRPGSTILQDRIGEFIIAHEEQEKQAKKEQERRAAEGGWTVVMHHKGRKKTTDSESGIAVGSVSQAAVLDKMAKKKTKDIGPDFYRFQKRDAQRNEVMMLQSKFEQDKKRIQQLRAARKFNPY